MPVVTFAESGKSFSISYSIYGDTRYIMSIRELIPKAAAAVVANSIQQKTFCQPSERGNGRTTCICPERTQRPASVEPILGLACKHRLGMPRSTQPPWLLHATRNSIRTNEIMPLRIVIYFIILDSMNYFRYLHPSCWYRVGKCLTRRRLNDFIIDGHRAISERRSTSFPRPEKQRLSCVYHSHKRPRLLHALHGPSSIINDLYVQSYWKSIFLQANDKSKKNTRNYS